MKTLTTNTKETKTWHQLVTWFSEPVVVIILTV